MALASRDPCNWVTKRERRWEESISSIAGSNSIVAKKAGVSLETPGCSCEQATHTHKHSVSHVETHIGQSHRGQEGRRTGVK